VLVYVGALGGYYLTEELVRALGVARWQDPSVFALILTQSPGSELERSLRSQGFLDEDYLIRRVLPAEIPRYLKAADLALSFIKPSYSKLSSSPTKFAEYLASGVPVLCSAGVGDLDRIVEEDSVGVLVRGFSDDEFMKALSAVARLEGDAETARRCRESAVRRFDLDTVGGPRYVRLYEKLLLGQDRDLVATAR
jgi:glycosyltransferase involved in cell wall biosynthesis